MTWSVADGARGRRWRAITTDAQGRLAHALLLETAPSGSVARLEVAAQGGLLTLHPDGPTLHGNVVRSHGIDHVTLPWPDGTMLLVEGSPVTAAAAVRLLAARVGVGEGHTVPAVAVDTELRARRATYRVARVAADRWWLLAADDGRALAVALDGDGIAVLDGATSWLLERDQDG